MSRRTENQELALARRRNASLDDAASKDPGFSCQGEIGEFISLYLKCELFATRLQHYYQKDKQHKQGKLNTESLLKALEHFGFSVDKDKLLLLFKGGEGKRGKKSARQLRNGYLHQLSDADRREIIEKHSVLTAEIKCFMKKQINTT